MCNRCQIRTGKLAETQKQIKSKNIGIKHLSVWRMGCTVRMVSVRLSRRKVSYVTLIICVCYLFLRYLLFSVCSHFIFGSNSLKMWVSKCLSGHWEHHFSDQNTTFCVDKNSSVRLLCWCYRYCC